MKRILALIGLAALLTGCASIQPGADPLVVRTEQAQAGAASSFDLVLHVNNANRSFWSTNAPAFNDFCQWLRVPQPYGQYTNLARAQVMQLQVDDLKAVYKATKTASSSNALYEAAAVLTTAAGQAQGWISVATNSIKLN